MAERLLEGTISLITGGSRGIGKAIGLAFAAHGGSRIYFVSRGDIPERRATGKEAEALQTVSEISSLGAEAVWIKTDVARDEGIETILSKLKDDRVRLDIFVNNAGNTFDALAQQNTAELLDASYNLNLRAPTLLACQLKARGLLAPAAKMIFNVSIVSEVPNTSQINYSVMKSGALQATRVLAEEWGPEGIRVNAILPGWVPTELTSNVGEVPLQMITVMTPLNRLGTPEDIAGVAVFLASNLSSFVTGAAIHVDGGLRGKAAATIPLHDAGYRQLTHKQRRELGIQ